MQNDTHAHQDHTRSRYDWFTLGRADFDIIRNTREECFCARSCLLSNPPHLENLCRDEMRLNDLEGPARRPNLVEPDRAGQAIEIDRIHPAEPLRMIQCAAGRPAWPIQGQRSPFEERLGK